MFGDEILDGPGYGDDEKNRKDAQKNQEPGEEDLGLFPRKKLLQKNPLILGSASRSRLKAIEMKQFCHRL